jgi:hypothetical protein
MQVEERMKLDIELIKEILFWCEETLPDESKAYQISDLKFEHFSTGQIKFHFHLLIENGYIQAINVSTPGQPFDYFPEYLTLDGYAFLEAIKSDTVWNGMKEEAAKIGKQAIKLALPILFEILTRQSVLKP